MTIQFFDESPESSGDLDFAADFLKANPNQHGKAFPITECLLARSGKGYMLKTDKFICWIWKKEKTTQLLLQALEVYVRDTYGYSIVAVLDKGAKNGFKLGLDPDSPCMWYGSGKKYTTTEDIPTLGMDNGNPFLLQPAPSTPTMPPATQNGRAKASSPQKAG